MKIIITDDHPLVRAGFRQAIEDYLTEYEVIETSSADELVELLGQNDHIDLILLDYYMPEVDGFEVLDRLVLGHPDIPVIILSACNDPAIMRRAIDLGAAGFITKNTSNDVLVNALRLVLAGGTYIPPSLLRVPGSALEHPHESQSVETASDRNPLDLLTHRQRDVLRLIAEGLTNKTISKRLGVTENTVKVHITSILKTLGATNRTQAVISAQQWGLDD